MYLESFKSIFIKAIFAGMLISIGGIVYLNVENKYLGGLLFSLGLFTILRYGFALYTGKVGYIPDRQPIYLREVGITLLGNIFGTGIAAALIRLSRIDLTIHENALNAMQTKMADGFISRMILGFFCGILMFIAVDNGNRCKAENRDMSFLFGTCMPVMVFIFCGFNHSIADCFYFFAAVDSMEMLLSGSGYLLTIIIGNALGGMFIPSGMKLFDNK